MESGSQFPLHAQSAEQALAAMESANTGLTTTNAAERLLQHGPNQLAKPQSPGALALFWRQVNNPISWVLLGAGFLSLGLGKHTDCLVVFAAVLINAVIGFLQEQRAGQAIAALAAMIPENATVLRDGIAASVPVITLVPGDLVTLASGDKVPADLRLLQCKRLRLDEATLTGESMPVDKSAEPVPAATPLSERRSMAYGGTMVTQGTATGLVVATGGRTELGRINQLLNQTASLETPLTRQLAVVSKYITVAVIAFAILLLLYGLFAKGATIAEASMTAITLAVAAIPEGLPAVITIALAIGVRRMAQRRAVVRHLPAVETLGSTSVICSDKTGTLTRNEMTAQALWCGDRSYRLSGIGYRPEGVLERDGIVWGEPPDDARALILAGTLCNDATLHANNGEWQISGDPTEAAIVVAARKLGMKENALRAAHPRVDVIPFESDTKYMATHNRGGGLDCVFLKGAPETVLDRCAASPELRQRALAAQDAFAAQGMRVLAVAQRSPPPAPLTPENTASGFTFLGLVGMIDPPRQEAIDAIARCHRAGIAVKMITGDHPITAAAIGQELGIASGRGDALTGNDLDKLDEAEFRAAASRYNVFARVSPEHKIKLIAALQADGNVVAMTGDGVNDAPALKRADIGVAMGITGTAVSQAAAKIVLTDDNFATIATAVEEGRQVYDNLIKSLTFVLPTNLALGLILAIGMLLFPSITVALDSGGEQRVLLLAMSPTQILWINLIASVTLSIPLAFEPLELGAMLRPPRQRGEPVFSAMVMTRAAVAAITMAAGCCILFLWEYFHILGSAATTAVPLARHQYALANAQTMAVTTVTLFQIFYLFHCRSLREGVAATGWFRNPAIWIGISALLLMQALFAYVPLMHRIFGGAPLDASSCFLTFAVAFSILPIVSAEKWLWRHAGTTPAPQSPSSAMSV